MGKRKASKPATAEAGAAELKAMCGLGIAACRKALTGAGGDVDKALAALIDSGAVDTDDLDPELVSDDLFGRASQRELDAALGGMLANTGVFLKGLPATERADAAKEMGRLQSEARQQIKASGASAKLMARVNRRREALDARPVSVKLPPLPELRLTLSDWVGADVLKTWAGFGRKRGSKGTVTVNIHRPWKDEDDLDPVQPAPEMVAAYTHLKDNEREVTVAVLEAVRAHINDELIGRYGWDLEPVADVKALKPMMELGSIHPLTVAKDGLAYVGLFFQCTWDEEHAAGVLLHGSRVIKVGDNEVCGDEFAALDDGGRYLPAWREAHPSKGKRPDFVKKTKARGRK